MCQCKSFYVYKLWNEIHMCGDEFEASAAQRVYDLCAQCSQPTHSLHTEHVLVHTPSERLCEGWKDWNVSVVCWNGINDIWNERRNSTEIEECTRENCANTNHIMERFVLLCAFFVHVCMSAWLFHFQLANSWILFSMACRQSVAFRLSFQFSVVGATKHDQ